MYIEHGMSKTPAAPLFPSKDLTLTYYFLPNIWLRVPLQDPCHITSDIVFQLFTPTPFQLFAILIISFKEISSRFHYLQSRSNDQTPHPTRLYHTNIFLFIKHSRKVIMPNVSFIILSHLKLQNPHLRTNLKRNIILWV